MKFKKRVHYQRYAFCRDNEGDISIEKIDQEIQGGGKDANVVVPSIYSTFKCYTESCTFPALVDCPV